MSIIDKMEKKLNKSLLLGFTGNDAEKLVVAQWLDKGVNAARIRWAEESNKKYETDDLVGKSMVMAGLVTMIGLTPAAIGIGAGVALLGEGVRFMAKLSRIGDEAPELIRTAKFNEAIDARKQAAAQKKPTSP